MSEELQSTVTQTPKRTPVRKGVVAASQKMSIRKSPVLLALRAESVVKQKTNPIHHLPLIGAVLGVLVLGVVAMNTKFSLFGSVGTVRSAGTAPTIVTIDEAPSGTLGSLGYSSSVAISFDGAPVFTYYDNLANLKVAKCSQVDCSGTINRTTILTNNNSRVVGAEGPSPIVIGSDHFPIIASVADRPNGNFYLFKCKDMACSKTDRFVIESNNANIGYSAIAVGPDQKPVVAYVDYKSPAAALTRKIKIAKCLAVDCATGVGVPAELNVTSGNVAVYPGVGVDASNNPIVSYMDSGTAKQIVLKCGNDTCTSVAAPVEIESVDRVVAPSTSYRVTGVQFSASTGLPIIIYRKIKINSLFLPDGAEARVAWCANSDCSGITTTNTINLAQSAFTGSAFPTATLSNGDVLVGSWGSSTKDLTVHQCNPTTCNQVNVYNTGSQSVNQIWFTAMAVGRNQKVMVTFADPIPTGKLKLMILNDIVVTAAPHSAPTNFQVTALPYTVNPPLDTPTNVRVQLTWNWTGTVAPVFSSIIFPYQGTPYTNGVCDASQSWPSTAITTAGGPATTSPYTGTKDQGGFAANTQYCFRLQATGVDAANNFTDSAFVYVGPVRTAAASVGPTTSTLSLVSPQPNNAVGLTWTASTGDASSLQYVLYRSTSAIPDAVNFNTTNGCARTAPYTTGLCSVSRSLTDSDKPLTDSNVTVGTPYNYRIMPFDSSNIPASLSNTVTATPQAAAFSFTLGSFSPTSMSQGRTTTVQGAVTLTNRSNQSVTISAQDVPPTGKEPLTITPTPSLVSSNGSNALSFTIDAPDNSLGDHRVTIIARSSTGAPAMQTETFVITVLQSGFEYSIVPQSASYVIPPGDARFVNFDVRRKSESGTAGSVTISVDGAASVLPAGVTSIGVLPQNYQLNDTTPTVRVVGAFRVPATGYANRYTLVIKGVSAGLPDERYSIPITVVTTDQINVANLGYICFGSTCAESYPSSAANAAMDNATGFLRGTANIISLKENGWIDFDAPIPCPTSTTETSELVWGSKCVPQSGFSASDCSLSIAKSHPKPTPTTSTWTDWYEDWKEKCDYRIAHVHLQTQPLCTEGRPTAKQPRCSVSLKPDYTGKFCGYTYNQVVGWINWNNAAECGL